MQHVPSAQPRPLESPHVHAPLLPSEGPRYHFARSRQDGPVPSPVAALLLTGGASTRTLSRLFRNELGMTFGVIPVIGGAALIGLVLFFR